MAYMKKRQSTTISVFEIGLFFFVNALLTFDLIWRRRQIIFSVI